MAGADASGAFSGTNGCTRRRSARLRGWAIVITAKATSRPPTTATSTALSQELSSRDQALRWYGGVDTRVRDGAVYDVEYAPGTPSIVTLTATAALAEASDW